MPAIQLRIKSIFLNIVGPDSESRTLNFPAREDDLTCFEISLTYMSKSKEKRLRNSLKIWINRPNVQILF